MENNELANQFKTLVLIIIIIIIIAYQTEISLVHIFIMNVKLYSSKRLLITLSAAFKNKNWNILHLSSTGPELMFSLIFSFSGSN